MHIKKINYSVSLFILILTISLNPLQSSRYSPKPEIEVFNTLPTKVKMLVPCGKLIGVVLNTEGIFVVGFSDIEDSKLIRQSPALINGMQMGDCIYSVNGNKLLSSRQLAYYVKNSEGEKLVFKLRRKSKILTISVRPLISSSDKSYKIGLWVRDSTKGVGTLTFFDPVTSEFGALGHPINDIDTGILLPIKDGKIYSAKVSSVEIGSKGKPGELIGMFYENNSIGELEQNTLQGVYGKIDKRNKMVYSNNIAIPIGYQNEVVQGPAKILTTVGGAIKYYDINIERLTKQTKPDSKGIVIRVTDKELLKKTGGIVQGMSGSPIIQNGKLIGAVTHVLVNRPDMGYGIYIEWMLKQLKTER